MSVWPWGPKATVRRCWPRSNTRGPTRNPSRRPPRRWAAWRSCPSAPSTCSGSPSGWGESGPASETQQVEQMKAGELAAGPRQPPAGGGHSPGCGQDPAAGRRRAARGARAALVGHEGRLPADVHVGPACEHDPQPEPPAVFLDPPRVMRLCQEIEQVRGNPATRPTAAKADTPLVGRSGRERPQRLVRTAVATMQGTEAFGWMVAAEAMRRGFYQAAHRAVVGDGGNWIEPLGQMHFPGWVQILDFLHLLVHLYAAATAAYREQGSGESGWRLYERMLRAAWAGQVAQVQAELREHLERLGPPPARGQGRRSAQDRVVGTWRTSTDNAERMDYPRYRREGLPVTSTIVESLIKQFNQRVKGTEKFWLRRRGRGHPAGPRRLPQRGRSRRGILCPPPPRPRRRPKPPPAHRMNGHAPASERPAQKRSRRVEGPVWKQGPASATVLRSYDELRCR